VIHQEAEIVPLSGREEELVSAHGSACGAAVVSTILSRCVRRLGSISPVPRDVTRGMLVTDRQYLLLKLREVTFGNSVRATIDCPWSECGKRIDLVFSLDAIPVRESLQKSTTYTVSLPPQAGVLMADEEPACDITFRLPTGGDQEALSALFVENEARALTLLLQRCIQRIGRMEQPGEEAIQQLSSRARHEIARAMEEASPRIDLIMDATCPECGRRLEAPFDIQRYLFSEMETSRAQLDREVHYLAWHYHWGEREIMDMPRQDRHRYMEVLSDQIEQLNHGL